MKLLKKKANLLSEIGPQRENSQTSSSDIRWSSNILIVKLKGVFSIYVIKVGAKAPSTLGGKKPACEPNIQAIEFLGGKEIYVTVE